MRAKIALYKNPEHSAAREAAAQQAAMSDDDEEGGDFPDVLLHELVDEMQEMQLGGGADEPEALPDEDDDESMAGA